MKSPKILITGGSGFIGTNLIDLLSKTDATIINLDITAPLSPDHNKYWKQVDFLDRPALEKSFTDFQPAYVIDLAARTDCEETTTVEEGYMININGVRNLISVINACPSVSRVVFTSTQYVHQPGPIPSHDEDYAPHTVYGQSKILMEKEIRNADIPCTWTIIRPTNVWGPWHLRYRQQFFRVIRKGYYFHPSGCKCVKSYAYVGTVVEQIWYILNADSEQVQAKTLYVGNNPLPVLDWVNGFSLALRGSKVRTIPRVVYSLMALTGDLISFVTRKQFLITTSRYKNMTEDYLTPMSKTFDILGQPQHSMGEGIEQTIEWLKSYDIKQRDKTSQAG